MFDWKITRLSLENDELIDCHYMVSVSDGTNTVKTEGNWEFSNKILDKPFNELTEQDVIDRIKQESCFNGLNIIESRLQEQLQNMSKNQHLPWLPAIFKPKF